MHHTKSDIDTELHRRPFLAIVLLSAFGGAIGVVAAWLWINTR